MKVELKFLRGQRVYYSGSQNDAGAFGICSGIIEAVRIDSSGCNYVLAGSSNAGFKEHELFATVEGIDSYLRESIAQKKSLQAERSLTASGYMGESVKNWVNGIPEVIKKERDSSGRFKKK